MKNCFLCLIINLLMSCFALKGNKDTKYNNCFTWTDDPKALFLTCRVSNFELPVTFTHANSETNVTCTIKTEEQKCIPAGQTYSMNKTEHTLTIVLVEEKKMKNLNGTFVEEKKMKDLNGRWHCYQGKSTQSTEVSLDSGIIIDSWVQLQGKSFFEGGSKYIYLECSSCRTPKNLYAEFLVNNKTKASLLKTKNGDCTNERLNCKSLDNCNCSQVGNMFSFSIRIQEINTSTNFSCHMQFNDSLRRGIFSTTASHIYTGKDFVIIENSAEVLRNNTPIAIAYTPTTHHVENDASQTTRTSTLDTMPSEKPELADNKDAPITTIVVIASVVVMCVIGGLIARYYYNTHKVSRGNNTIKFSPVPTDQDEVIPLLDSKVCMYCKSSSNDKYAEFLCFDCYKMYCRDCNIHLHSITEEMQSHKFAPFADLPISFSLSFFECHACKRIGQEPSFYKYVCNDHDQLCCIICQKRNHSNCKTEQIKTFTTERVEKLSATYYSALETFDNQLAAYWVSILHGQNKFVQEVAKVKQILKSLSIKRFQLATTETGEINILSQMKDLNKFKVEYKTTVNIFLEEIKKWRLTINTQEELLAFLKDRIGSTYYVPAWYKFQSELWAMRNDIDEFLNERKIYDLTIRINKEKNKVIVTKSKVDSKKCLETLQVFLSEQSNDMDAFKLSVYSNASVSSLISNGQNELIRNDQIIDERVNSSEVQNENAVTYKHRSASNNVDSTTGVVELVEKVDMHENKCSAKTEPNTELIEKSFSSDSSNIQESTAHAAEMVEQVNKCEIINSPKKSEITTEEAESNKFDEATEHNLKEDLDDLGDTIYPDQSDEAENKTDKAYLTENNGTNNSATNVAKSNEQDCTLKQLRTNTTENPIDSTVDGTIFIEPLHNKEEEQYDKLQLKATQ